MRKTIFLVIIFLLMPLTHGLAEENRFVGSEACKECHEAEYENFTKYSKKANSFESIKKMKTKLTPEEFQSCFQCHTTGYGKRSGFVSEGQTPHLKNTGCEICHGPGSRHVESEDPEEIIRTISMDKCVQCHDKDRVVAFDFKPLIYGGAH